MLSAKLDDAPHGDILDAAERFEEFVAAKITGQKPSKKAHSKIEEIEATVRRIVAGAAEAELDIQEMGPPKLRKPNRISRNPPKWPHKR